MWCRMTEKRKYISVFFLVLLFHMPQSTANNTHPFFLLISLIYPPVVSFLLAGSDLTSTFVPDELGAGAGGAGVAVVDGFVTDAGGAGRMQA